MRTSTIVWIVVVVIVLGGAWYWYDSTHGPTQAQTPSQNVGLNNSNGQTNTGQQTVPPVVTAKNDPALGNYLVASNGITLYKYTKDTANVSNCSGACATIWPPYAPTANEALVAGDGVSGTLSTITRADGSSQVTYNGMPLYFYQKDTQAGDKMGQNVGGVWFVVAP